MGTRGKENPPYVLFTDGSPQEAPWLNQVQDTLLENGLPFKVVIGESDPDKGFAGPSLIGGPFFTILEDLGAINNHAKSVGRERLPRSRRVSK